MAFVAGNINYAESYSKALAQAYPYVLNFGKLYNVENDTRYQWIDSKTIKIPTIRTSGRVNASRDTIGIKSRNYDNAWETKTLTNERKWGTLVHPKDVDQTNMVASIANITKVFNEEQKFPEKDAYLISKLYSAWTTAIPSEGYEAHSASTTALSINNILEVFDTMMLNMDNARVPANGRILYCTHEVKKLLKNADKIQRTLDVENGNTSINRIVNRLDEVEIIGVPATLMKTAYDFTEGWTPAATASQVNMFLVHPSAVITPESYDFATLDAPSAGSEGKYDYYEESHEDVFILNHKADALQFNITPYTPTQPSPSGV